jgi:WD40 repeat protein
MAFSQDSPESTLPGVKSAPAYEFDGFISYRHDGRQREIASRLQRGLHQFAKPIRSLRAVRLYRDETNLGARPELWKQIVAALDRSKYFMLMASQEAAKSPWVQKEFKHWRDTRGSKGIIIVVTDGVVRWSNELQDFDPCTNVLPAAAIGSFGEEPLWIDLRWVTDPKQQLALKNRPFRNAVASISSTLRDKEKDELDSEDLEIQQNRLRIAVSAAILVSTLAVAFFLQRQEAARQRDEAQSQRSEADRRRKEAQRQRLEADTQRSEALARLLAAEGFRIVSSDTASAVPFFLTSLKVRVTPNALSGLFVCLQGDPHVGMQFLGLENEVSCATLQSSAATAAIGTSGGEVVVWKYGTDNSSAGEQALQRGQKLSTLKTGSTNAIRAVGLAEKGNRVLAIDDAGAIYQWNDLIDGVARKVADFPAADVSQREDGTPEIVVSANAESAAAATYSGQIALWSVQIGRTNIVLPNAAGGGPLALDDSGLFLTSVVAGLDPPLVVYNIRERSFVEIPHPSFWPSVSSCVALSPDHAFVASGHSDGSVLIWKFGPKPAFARVLRHMRTVSTKTTIVHRIDFDETGTYLATFFQGHWYLWDVKTGIQIGRPIQAALPVSAYAGGRPKLLITPDKKSVQLIDHSIEHLRYWACLTGRPNIQPNVWRDLVGEAIPHIPGCP